MIGKKNKAMQLLKNRGVQFPKLNLTIYVKNKNELESLTKVNILDRVQKYNKLIVITVPQTDLKRNLSQQNNSGSGNLSDKPGGLKSKDDTIYDGMYEDGDLYFGGLRTRWNSRHFYQVNDNISRHLGAYNALR